MRGVKADLTGKKFGRLLALRPTKVDGVRKWECLCECGKSIFLSANVITSGNTRSCGCLKRETTAKNRLKDLTGKRFGRLVVVERCLGSAKPGVWWSCVCDCGKTKEASTSGLTQKHTSSCGCYRYERRAAKTTIHGYTRRGASALERKVHRTWKSMIRRCYDPNIVGFKYYGMRGVKVCEEWRNSFTQFVADMGLPPSLEHSIDRIDGRKDYEPGNCRWATCKQQSRNLSKSINVTVNGETRNLADWADISGIPYYTLYSRYKKYGFSPERLLCPVK